MDRTAHLGCQKELLAHSIPAFRVLRGVLVVYHKSPPGFGVGPIDHVFLQTEHSCVESEFPISHLVYHFQHLSRSLDEICFPVYGLYPVGVGVFLVKNDADEGPGEEGDLLLFDLSIAWLRF